MNSYAVIRAILSLETLTHAEKVVGTVIALHLDRKNGSVRLKQETIAKEAGVSTRVVQSATTKLVQGGVFESKRTGRSTILRPMASVRISVRVDTKQASDQTRSRARKRGNGKMPWDYDLTHSTKCEEEHKRPLFLDINPTTPTIKKELGEPKK